MIASLLLLAVVAAPADSTPESQASTAKTPREALVVQIALFRQGRFRVEYETMFTPNYRARCPWARFLRNARRDRRVLGAWIRVTNIRTRIVDPAHALLAYVVRTADGRTLTITFRQRDVYTKIGQYWYDEMDRVTRCPA